MRLVDLLARNCEGNGQGGGCFADAGKARVARSAQLGKSRIASASESSWTHRLLLIRRGAAQLGVTVAARAFMT